MDLKSKALSGSSQCGECGVWYDSKPVRLGTSAQNTTTVRDPLGNMMSAHLARVLLTVPIRANRGQLHCSFLLQGPPGPRPEPQKVTNLLWHRPRLQFKYARQHRKSYTYTNTLFSQSRISRKYHCLLVMHATDCQWKATHFINVCTETMFYN